jgi:hypothetical protein
MSLNYDLHCHSTASDGTLRPAELAALAAERGVDVLALTDHDATEGLDEAAATAEEYGIGLVPGVEISVTWERQTVHIVGLGIDPDNAVLQAGLARLREFRVWRGAEIGRRLEAAGVEGAYEGAVARSGGDTLSRTHFAHFLIDNGYAKDVKDVFKRYMKSGKPGHVAGQWAELGEAVAWIHAAGGEAVIAHPARYDLTARRMRRLFGQFQEAGGEAIEVVSGSHGRGEAVAMAAWAREFGFRASRGSDYHGPERTWAELGRVAELPEGCEPVWSAWGERYLPRTCEEVT